MAGRVLAEHDEPWQEFHQNGEMLAGVHGDRAHFKNPERIMGGVARVGVAQARRGG